MVAHVIYNKPPPPPPPPNQLTFDHLTFIIFKIKKCTSSCTVLVLAQFHFLSGKRRGGDKGLGVGARVCVCVCGDVNAPKVHAVSTARLLWAAAQPCWALQGQHVSICPARDRIPPLWKPQQALRQTRGERWGENTGAALNRWSLNIYPSVGSLDWFDLNQTAQINRGDSR